MSEKTFRLVIIKIPKTKEKEIFDELLYPLIKRGIIETSQVHMIDEDELINMRR